MHAKDTLKRASNDEDAFRSKSVEWVREDVVVDRRGGLVNRGSLWKDYMEKDSGLSSPGMSLSRNTPRDGDLQEW